MTSAEDTRELVALGCRILAANGHEDYVWGHVSARDPGGRGIWMKASTFGFDEITAEHVILVSFDGEVLVGDHPRHIEWPIHTEVMRARADVSGVVHSHPPHAIALGASGRPLRAISHAATMFVPPDVPRYTRTGELIVSAEMGADVALSLAGAARLPARQPRDRDRRRGRARRSHPRRAARERGAPADADRGARRRVALLAR